MGRFCWMCGEERANERFSGKGHRRGVCRDCERLPKPERERIAALAELHGYVEQSNISPANAQRIAALAGSPDPEVARLAELVAEIARVHPRREKRQGTLRHHHPELFARMGRHGLVGEPEPPLVFDPPDPEAADAGPDREDEDWR